jgi:hypothetical protein
MTTLEQFDSLVFLFSIMYVAGFFWVITQDYGTRTLFYILGKAAAVFFFAAIPLTALAFALAHLAQGVLGS